MIQVIIIRTTMKAMLNIISNINNYNNDYYHKNNLVLAIKDY